MRQLKIPAAFVRGGTSNGIAFLKENLPPDRDDWKEIFLAAMGSPDPNRRQLNGMGGGISRGSKSRLPVRSHGRFYFWDSSEAKDTYLVRLLVCSCRRRAAHQPVSTA